MFTIKTGQDGGLESATEKLAFFLGGLFELSLSKFSRGQCQSNLKEVTHKLEMLQKEHDMLKEKLSKLQESLQEAQSRPKTESKVPAADSGEAELNLLRTQLQHHIELRQKAEEELAQQKSAQEQQQSSLSAYQALLAQKKALEDRLQQRKQTLQEFREKITEFQASDNSNSGQNKKTREEDSEETIKELREELLKQAKLFAYEEAELKEKLELSESSVTPTKAKQRAEIVELKAMKERALLDLTTLEAFLRKFRAQEKIIQRFEAQAANQKTGNET